MKNILIHLRIPFSVFLSPVFFFAWSQASDDTHHAAALWIAAILHLLIYPASNAYNSYFDKDEGPIGGIAQPPPVDERLFWVAWLLDLIGVALAWAFVSPLFAGQIFLYGLVSKAYSDDRVRLKKYPIISWLVVGFFQGFFIYLSVIHAIDDVSFAELWAPKHLLPALLCSVNLWGFYPMTQIYQHDEDARRGDLTLSRLLGIRGTFLCTAALFGLATAGFGYYFWGQKIGEIPVLAVYLIWLLPALLFFQIWFFKTWKDPRQANFQNTMVLNLLGSLCLNGFFLTLWYVRIFA
jgi:UbiA prenyltransferase family